MLNNTFSKRFAELERKSNSIQFTKGINDLPYVAPGVWEEWATSAQNLIIAVFGEDSPHHKNFSEAFVEASKRASANPVKRLQGIFRGAKEDFDGGYVFNVDLRISGEVFGDFIVLAKHTLAEGHKDVAAVLACAALEDALKRYAIANGLNVNEKSMADVINALKSKGLVSGAQKSLLGAMPKLRNDALHADWEKISEPEVNGVIGFVEQFLLTKFTPA